MVAFRYIRLVHCHGNVSCNIPKRDVEIILSTFKTASFRHFERSLIWSAWVNGWQVQDEYCTIFTSVYSFVADMESK